MATPPTVFLDANVLRGQLTTDVVLSIAHTDLYRPRWSAEVLDEVKRNRPEKVTAERTDARFAQMAKAFPKAMVKNYEHLMPEMQADEKDKHVLAAAVRSGSDVLVTENVKDFHPPTAGLHAMKIQRTSEFLGRLVDEEPQLVIEAMQTMVDRNRRPPQSIPELIDKMATLQELKGFAHKLNTVVPLEQRGSHPHLQTSKAAKVAFEGVAGPMAAVTKPAATPEARKDAGGPAKAPEKEL
ncbi:PIN domain-containing protein [Kribbella sp. NPDC023855]|uniref:PIN domain-containing protein n=1 Tax=Kribbella sp. NPDC023855 TaxID=3154698 RepID=UPI00340480BC